MSNTLPLLAALTLAAAVWDLRTRRIPNELVFCGLVAGLAAGAAVSGLYGFGHALLGAAVGLGALLFPWTRGWVGGGDVKLFAACGALMGWQGVLGLLLVGSALHGLLTLGVVAVAKLRKQSLNGAPFAPAVAAAVPVLAISRPALLSIPQGV
ncbi:MAG: prepilin peptidase [Deltaproteobacteria bacterium]|nr:prepilin peptidase [Deltaproteobacteria bacterium]